MNLKQKLSKKLKKTGGFTLIEMLIVVAIIAILVAVSIPMVNASLDKARENTDAANERAAKAAALAQYLLTDTAGDYVYNAGTGVAEIGGNSENYGQCSEHKGAYITVTVTDAGSATVKWSNGKKAHGIPETTAP